MKTLTIVFLKGKLSGHVLVTTGDVDQVVCEYNSHSPGYLEVDPKDEPIRASFDEQILKDAFCWTGGNWCIMRTNSRFYKSGEAVALHQIVSSLLTGYTTDPLPQKIGKFLVENNQAPSSYVQEDDDF